MRSLPSAATDFVREVAQTLHPPADDRHGPLVPMMVALTFVTGSVDAVSYLKLGHVFVANMTGNVVFLGFALAGASGLSAPSSLAALGSFLVGALAGGWLVSRASEHRGRMLRASSAAQATMVACALVVSAATGDPPSTGVRYALLVLLALAMGVQNATAQRLSIPELTTTVLTRTLTGLASEAHALGGPGSRFGRRVVAVAAMLLGALIGGLIALEVSIAVALTLPAATVVLVGLAVHALSKRSPTAVWAHP